MLRFRSNWISAALAVGSLLSGNLARAAEAYLQRNEKILWTGDSITAQNLYETYVMRVLGALYPDGAIRDFNSGVGGATAPSNFAGTATALEREQPTLLTVMFGVNDTGWSTGNENEKITKYTGGLEQYIDLAKQKNIPLLLLRETHFSHNKAGEDFVNNMNGVLGQLFAAQDALAARKQVPLVDAYGAYTHALEKAWEADPKYEFTPNVIHPTMLGHAAVAGEILKGLGAGLPLSSAPSRGPLHLEAAQAVNLAAEPQFGVSADGGLKLKVGAQSNVDKPLDGMLLVVAGGKQAARPLSLGPRASASETFDIAGLGSGERWEVEPIYIAFVAGDVFAASETPLYRSRLVDCQKQPFKAGADGWFAWEGGKPERASTVSDVQVGVQPDRVRVEFTWRDTTPVLAKAEPYKARLGESVTTPLDMTSPFGQPCDAVEVFLDLRDAATSARYTSNMDSIPAGTARVGLYRIEEGGKPVFKLQVAQPAPAGSFRFHELGADRFAIEYEGALPDCSLGFNMFASDAATYEPNKPTGAYLTTVPRVGTDWVGFFRLSAGKSGVFSRVGY